jgi:hypothetical protein
MRLLKMGRVFPLRKNRTQKSARVIADSVNQYSPCHSERAFLREESAFLDSDTKLSAKADSSSSLRESSE